MTDTWPIALMLSRSWNSDFLTCFDNADEATAEQRRGGEGKPGSQYNLLVVVPSCLPALYCLNSWNSYEKKATFILIKSLWLEFTVKAAQMHPWHWLWGAPHLMRNRHRPSKYTVTWRSFQVLRTGFLQVSAFTELMVWTMRPTCRQTAHYLGRGWHTHFMEHHQKE